MRSHPRVRLVLSTLCLAIFPVVSGCTCGPYPDDASGFRWEQESVRDRQLEVRLAVAGSEQGDEAAMVFKPSANNSMRCTVPLALSGEVVREVDWKLTESTDSFKSGLSDKTFRFTEPGNDAAAMAESGASDEAIKAKPKADVGRRMDSSANFEKYPVRVSWRIETTEGNVLKQGEAEIRSGAAAASFEMQIDNSTLARIANAEQSVVPVVSVTPIGSPGTLASREIRGSEPLKSDDVWRSGLIGPRPAEYRFAAIRESEQPVTDGDSLVFTFMCDVKDRQVPARTAPCEVKWELASSSGGTAPYEGPGPVALSDGRIVIKIDKTDDAVKRLYKQSAPNSSTKRAPTFALSVTVRIGEESRTCKSSPIKRSDLDVSGAGADAAESGSESGT